MKVKTNKPKEVELKSISIVQVIHISKLVVESRYPRFIGKRKDVLIITVHYKPRHFL